MGAGEEDIARLTFDQLRLSLKYFPTENKIY